MKLNYKINHLETPSSTVKPAWSYLLKKDKTKILMTDSS